VRAGTGGQAVCLTAKMRVSGGKRQEGVLILRIEAGGMLERCRRIGKLRLGQLNQSKDMQEDWRIVRIEPHRSLDVECSLRRLADINQSPRDIRIAPGI